MNVMFTIALNNLQLVKKDKKLSKFQNYIKIGLCELNNNSSGTVLQRLSIVIVYFIEFINLQRRLNQSIKYRPPRRRRERERDTSLNFKT